MADRPAGAPRAVGLLGGGVIGGGWAARFVTSGVDVRLYDPDPRAPETVARLVENARRAIRRLTLAPLPREGRVETVASPEAAVEGVELVQESAPEREELKRALLARASRAAGPDALVCSSTSGLRPSRLQADMCGPERLAVAHPFNPVYLVPLVELCGGERTAPETLARAEAIYRAVGMRPLVVRREIDGFVADRLLEALWREALWLVHDDVATVSEVDDAIRFGPGLRWSVMGTFLAYRLGGGDAGIRGFLEQFAPALRWPWTKLTDVPEVTPELVEKLADQSDRQAAGRSTEELERVRDDCLVSIVQALRAHAVGAGAVLAEYERALYDAAPVAAAAVADGDGDAGPLRLHTARVEPEWVDYNGHAHESRYLQVCGDASDALFRHLGIDAAYLAAGGSYFTVETHLSHLREASAGEPLAVATQVLGFDEKRLHVFHSLERTTDGALLATAEQLFVHVDTRAGRAGPAGPDVLERVARIAAAHADLPRPERAGRRIGLRRDGGG
jgi:carnitine 3-dehydrogenase